MLPWDQLSSNAHSPFTAGAQDLHPQDWLSPLGAGAYPKPSEFDLVQLLHWWESARALRRHAVGQQHIGTLVQSR